MAETIPIDLNNPAQNKLFREIGGSDKYALTMGTIIDTSTGQPIRAAGGEGSYAVPWTEVDNYKNLPDAVKKQLFGAKMDTKGYNPFADVVGYAVDPTTNQVILKYSNNSSGFSSARVATDASGNLVEVAPTVKTSTNTATTVTSTSTATISTGYTGSGITGDPLKFNGVPFTGAYLGQNFIGGISEVASAAKAERQSAYDALLVEFNKYGLGSLIQRVKGLIEKDVSPSQFVIELRNTPEYQQRFSANQERLKRGLSSLSEAEYIRNEDNYRQILRTYGLTQFDNDDYVKQFLVNDISPQELGERVVTAVNRVQTADKSITETLKRYYGLKDSDMVAAILDPTTQLPSIQRQITAAEIGAAAGRQGLNAGRFVSEQLAAQGVTKEQAERGYATIADILPTAEKLSDIYGTTLDRYGLAEGEQEVFNQLASAQRKRQRLASREIAEFSGQSGVARGSLGTSTGGQY
jgi:hypothetical protein